MVDINDVNKLEQHFRQAEPLDDAVVWARKHGIPSHVRYATIHALYSRYGSNSNTDLVLKMVRSKTGMNDPERLFHELIIAQYPNWSYEVPSPIGGSIDFIGDVPEIGKCIIEVKAYASWKQAATITLYQREYPEHEMLAVYFGKHSKTETIVRALNNINIFVGEVDEYGKIRLLKNRIEPTGADFW